VCYSDLDEMTETVFFKIGRMLTYDDVFSRMLTYADVCWQVDGITCDVLVGNSPAKILASRRECKKIRREKSS
jgi:hypothetical protein